MDKTFAKMSNIFKDYKIGSKDRFEHTITYIHSCTENYIIYESDNNVLHYDEGEGDLITKKISPISFEMAVIKILIGNNISRNENTLIALAWKESFEDNIENSKKILQTLTKQLLVKGKMTYVLSSFFTVLLTLAIALIVNNVLAENPLPKDITIPNICLLGSIGGFISILIKLNKLYLDSHSKKLNVIAGVSRILISISSALVFYFAYKSRIILAFFDSITQEEEIYLIMVCSIIIGFMERFIPELANQVSNLIKKE